MVFLETHELNLEKQYENGTQLKINSKGFFKF